MPIALTGPPEVAAAQLIAHLKRTGVLDASGNVAESAVAISAQADSPAPADGASPVRASQPERMAASHQARMQLYITIRPAVTATDRGRPRD